MKPKLDETLKEKLKDPLWRINNLYWIKDSDGRRIKFQLNWAQRYLWEEMHACNIVLKARQLGITTFFCIFQLDKVLWERGIQTGIIAHTLDDASYIFRDKLKFAFDNLRPDIRQLFKPVGDSAKELTFSHGSGIRVGTSLRSATNQYLHISEFGKICAKSPDRAREIISGSLNTVHIGQHISIESTAEGKEGHFYDMCQLAQKRPAQTPQDFKFFFFPWWKHPEYTQGVPYPISHDLKEYFDKLHLDGIKLTDPQKWWYANKYEIQQEFMFREFPSKPEEAFQASQEGYWYSSIIKGLWDTGHITNVSYDRGIPVHTAWDLGQSDNTAVWFFQVNRTGDINIIDFWQKNNTALDQIVGMLKGKGYVYGHHIWPTDASARDRSGITFVQQCRALGINGTVLEPQSFIAGINLVKTTITKCWFDKVKCAEGIRMLENYKRRWNAQFVMWTSDPVHDECSHAADAFRYLCSGISKVSSNGSIETDYKALRNYWG